MLLGLVDTDNKLIYADVWYHGGINDGGVFRNASLSKVPEKISLNIAAVKSLLGGDKALPFVVVADDAFPLTRLD